MAQIAEIFIVKLRVFEHLQISRRNKLHIKTANLGFGNETEWWGIGCISLLLRTHLCHLTWKSLLFKAFYSLKAVSYPKSELKFYLHFSNTEVIS